MTSVRNSPLVYLAALAVALASPGVRATPAAAAAEAHAHRATRTPVLPAPPEGTVGNVPRFTLFGWVSPPLAMTTPAHYADMAAAGFNPTLLAFDDSGSVADNRVRLGVTRPLGMRDLLLDNRLDSVFAAVPSSWPIADSIATAYRDDPAFTGYYLGDEPPDSTFGRLAEWFSLLRQRDPGHPSWNSLVGRMGFPSHAAYEDYTRRYVAAVRPSILCNSQYDFNTAGDLHELTENVSTLAGIARDNHRPFWGVVLLLEHGPFRYVTDGMLRWQVAQWIAYGATGVGYFTYWTPAPDPWHGWHTAMVTWDTGAPTAMYDTVTAINRHLAPIGNTLAGATWLATEHAGSVPPYGTPFAPNSVVASVTGRATVGFFADSAGAPLVFVANADSVDRRVIGVGAAGGRTVERLMDDGGGWSPWSQFADGTTLLSLGPGDFALLRFSGTVDPVTLDAPRAGPGSRARLDVLPNPARGAVRFAVSGGTPGSRLVLLDLAGRRIWSTVCAGTTATLEWRGEREQGGSAPAGFYVARYEDGRGAAVRRVHWLGAR